MAERIIKCGICEKEFGTKQYNKKFCSKECCICRTNENIEFHHPDYNFQLSVYPICKNHHMELHRNEVSM